MYLGRYGGVQVMHDSIPGGKEAQQIISSIQDSPPKAEESGTDLMRLMRYQLTRCEAVFGEDRFGIVLPREFRDMGLLPNQGEVAALLIVGKILEIWRADKWVEHIRAVRGSLPETIGRALDELENR